MKSKVLRLSIFILAVGFIAAWLIWAPCFCQASPLLSAGDDRVKINLIADTKYIVPGKHFRLGVQLIMSPGWHTYYKEPGDAGMATKIIWQLPPGFRSGPLLWERPEKFSDAGITTYGYADKTLIAAIVTPPDKLPAGTGLTFSARVEWLACKDLCVPGHAGVQMTMNTADAGTAKLPNALYNDEFAKANFDGAVAQLGNDINQKFDVLKNTPDSQGQKVGNNILLYFIFAFLGGILLNFMPCVLPVVAIKVLSLLEQTSKESARATTIAFAAGIFSSFLFLGLFVIGLQAAGHQVGWGFQFQQPVFLMFMCVLVLLFALSLFGLFDVSFSFGQRAVDQLADQKGSSGDFFKGVLATILSTPCTAPFLGTALGFAFVQPWSITLAIFAAIGLGMCLPYIILIVAPGYIRFLPKPGIWMEKLKEAFGFILLATTIWLVSVLSDQIDNERLIAFVYFLLIMSFAIWLMNRFTNLASSSQRIAFIRFLALLIVASAGYFCLFDRPMHVSLTPVSNEGQTNLESFSVARLNQALSSGKTVFLDFTARWCLTCQVNESTALNTTAVQEKMRMLHVVYMKADWTKQDPTITALLKKFGRSGVPLYVIFPGKNPSQSIILPELITQQIVLDKLDQAGPSRNQ
jgi:thiol:disulfide interchange protein